MPGIDECLLQVMLVPGARGAAIVDWISGLALGTVGESAHSGHEAAAAETAELARVATEYATFATYAPEDPTPVEDLIVTTRTGYHLVRFVDTAFDGSVLLHLWLDRDLGNLALARLRLRHLSEGLVLG
ncbi:hypothetical protein SLUN_15850 [Streptomyces lunaelactis]|uniref:Uncharacterized protein n=1 Tax=Streptomyces lunaelactis TaxID=1535768 RepID=A0A2R4T2V2_9ACTN|nr:hypothetical protein [Streptomyces lunaelactis]AVZ73431.1 hypothetical protein SLUN_15850 [Streptomyces lunaelactis]NUK88855.1 hypothetical protein [Streptomyces lunaelactis]NUL03470.1 hypothetical protein [Streptomyces lunaelactis]